MEAYCPNCGNLIEIIPMEELDWGEELNLYCEHCRELITVKIDADSKGVKYENLNGFNY